jgi:hypothetical protein
VVHALQDLLFLKISFVEVLREDLDCLVHWISQLDAHHSAGIVRQDWPEVHRLWHWIDLVVDTLTFDIENEWLLVISASEGQLLLELLVAVRCEHHVDCLSLSRE